MASKRKQVVAATKKSQPQQRRDVAVANPAAMAMTNVPDYLKGYKGPLGSESIDSKDVTIPRLKIAQTMSDEVKNGSLQEGDLFLNVTGEALWSPGDKPLPFVIIKHQKEYILWNPREDGGGILARANAVQTSDGRRYAWDKQNKSFDVKIGGKHKVTWKTKRYVDEDGLGDWGSEIPGDGDSGIAATAHHNYIVALPTHGNMIAALSLARSGAKKAMDLNAAIKMRGPVPLHSCKWTIVTIDETNDLGDFKNAEIKPNGWVDQREFPFYDQLAKGFQEKNINVDRSDAQTADDIGNKSDDDSM